MLSKKSEEFFGWPEFQYLPQVSPVVWQCLSRRAVVLEMELYRQDDAAFMCVNYLASAI